MAHVSEKFALGPVGRLSRLFQRSLLLKLVFEGAHPPPHYDLEPDNPANRKGKNTERDPERNSSLPLDEREMADGLNGCKHRM